MKRFGLIGRNVSYSYSKIIHEYLGKNLGIELSYDLISTDSLDKVNFGAYDGLNITIPYKQEVIGKLNSCNQFVLKIDSCNTVTNQLIGHNTDKDGFKYLCELLIDDLTKIKRVVILGNSNSGKMIKALFTDANCITISRNECTQENYFTYSNEEEIYGDLVINTTPIGQGIQLEDSPLKEELIKKFSYVIDLNYNPNINLFLNYAAANSIPNINGLGMLVVQAIKAFEIWNDLEVPKDLYDATYNYVDKLVNPKMAIIGMPYAGKTHYGNELSKQGKRVIDLDYEISQKTNMANDEFINKFGISEFRKMETQTLAQIVLKEYDVLILGGGIIEDFSNRLLLKHHRIQYLNVDFERLSKQFTLAKARGEETRPLTNDFQKLEAVYQRRKLIYPFFQNITIK